MRLSVSNIAWDSCDDYKIAKFLNENGVTAIDIAPTKYFSPEMNPSDSEIKKVKEFWASFGIAIVGMQSLLYGTSGLNVFDLSAHDCLFFHLEKVARIGSGLGASYLVFGSPKNRDTTGLTQEKVNLISKDFFNKLGDIGLNQGVIFCIEPNPSAYNCNFVTHSMEAATLVRNLNHPGIRMQLDTGTIVTNDENYLTEIEKYKDLVGHIHLSTSNLNPIVLDRTRLIPIINKIKNTFPTKIITIEMTTSASIFDSIKFAKEYV